MGIKSAYSCTCTLLDWFVATVNVIHVVLLFMKTVPVGSLIIRLAVGELMSS